MNSVLRITDSGVGMLSAPVRVSRLKKVDEMEKTQFR